MRFRSKTQQKNTFGWHRSIFGGTGRHLGVALKIIKKNTFGWQGRYLDVALKDAAMFISAHGPT